MNDLKSSRAAPRPNLDFNQAFKFFFEDPAWLPKLLMGTLFTALSFFVIGTIWVTGYVVGIIRRRLRGEPRPLPEWTDLGGLFEDGLRACLVSIAHLLPLLVLVFLFGLAGGGMMALLDGAPRTPAEIQMVFVLFVLTGYAFFTLVGLALMLYLPAAFVRFVVLDRLSAAFDFRANVAFIRRNSRSYSQALLVIFISSFVAQLGVFVLCIGFFPAAFWSFCVFGYVLGDLARQDEILMAAAQEVTP